MPRKQRFRVAGIPQLVHQRGHNGTSICNDRADFHTLWGCVAEAAAEHDCKVHAYALLRREFYLLITPATRDGVSRAMQAVGRQYVPWFNAVHQRSGALWMGRYRACLVEPGLQVLAACRYLEQHDDKAGCASQIGANRWSSAGAHLRGTQDSLIQDHPVYIGLGRESTQRARAYQALSCLPLAQDVTDEIGYALSHCLAYASESYKDWCEQDLGMRVRLGQPGRPSRALAGQAATLLA